jgi:hypothetical protein
MMAGKMDCSVRTVDIVVDIDIVAEREHMMVRQQHIVV